MPNLVGMLFLAHLQFGGGSSVISASSFWILFAEVVRALEALGAALASFLARSPPGWPPPPLVDVVAMMGEQQGGRERGTGRLGGAGGAPLREDLHWLSGCVDPDSRRTRREGDKMCNFVHGNNDSFFFLSGCLSLSLLRRRFPLPFSLPPLLPSFLV